MKLIYSETFMNVWRIHIFSVPRLIGQSNMYCWFADYTDTIQTKSKFNSDNPYATADNAIQAARNYASSKI